MTINEFFRKVYEELYLGYVLDTEKLLAPRIYCKDGKLSLSVQASTRHFCSPNDNFGPYVDVEVGFPSRIPPKDWAEYFDGQFKRNTAKRGVYHHVPVEVVEQWIDEHGGIDWEKTVRMWRRRIKRKMKNG